MKAFVDQNLCIGCGVCEAECPEVFHMTEDGLAVAVGEELSDAARECAEEAKNQCPVEAITIE